jgi:hypothetical protein
MMNNFDDRLATVLAVVILVVLVVGFVVAYSFVMGMFWRPQCELVGIHNTLECGIKIGMLR